MPSRKKPTERDAKESIVLSLREFGVRPMGVGQHARFYRKISQQALTQSATKHGATKVHLRKEILSKDKEKAIETVFVAELKEYLDDEMFAKKAEYVFDNLEHLLNKSDDSTRILQWAPHHYRNGALVTKPDFERFHPQDLDPFRRFQGRVKHVTPAQLAYADFIEDESGLLGHAFEAMVASHAAHNKDCPSCNKMNTLQWCGGSVNSWKDLYCVSCQSCFEIKSKKDEDAIDKIFRFDNYVAGSYRKWCEEDFTGRVRGTDYIVLVSREASFRGWAVYMAEIGTALPAAVARTFAEADKETVSIKTRLTMKNSQLWFHIPGRELPDLKQIFKQSFEQVFPNEWDNVDLGSHFTRKDLHCKPGTAGLSMSVDALATKFQRSSIGYWDDSDSDY